MLQFNATIYTITTRFTSRFLWRLNASLTTNAATVASESVNNVKEAASNSLINNEQRKAFNDLKTKLCSGLNVEASVSSKIQSAQSIHDLLEMMKAPLLSQTNIAEAMQTIAVWVNNNNNKTVSDTKDGNSSVQSQGDVKETQTKELNMPEDDISRYSDFSTSQMIKEINKLSQAGSRNVQLLNYLFQNIIEYNEELHPRACSSLMYSMSNLSYSDERLLQKICTDLISHMTRARDTIHVVTLLSIVKSMAIVRYKNDNFLNHVCQDIVNSKTTYKNKQIANILLSLASLGYHSEHVDKIVELYTPTFLIKTLGHIDWLNLVWSLAVFRKADASYVASVLNEDFIKKLMFFDPRKKLSYQLKLLNINGYAQYALDNYAGPFVHPDDVPCIVSKRSKQKQSYVNALELTLKNMLPSTSHYKMSVDTQMGFLLDAVLYMDSNLMPAPVDNAINEQYTKIGIMIVDYYDMCLGDADYQGLIKLYLHLLTCKKYDVLCVPYQHFGIEDKIEKRVSYLKRQLWMKFKKSF